MVFRFVDIVPVLILCPNILSELALQVVRAFGYINLHIFHFVNSGIDRACTFLYGIYLDSSVVYLLNQTWVCAVSNDFQTPRAKSLDDVRRKQSSTVIHFIQVKGVINDTTTNGSRRVMRITEVLPESNFLCPSRELVNNSPLLEHSTFCHVSPATDNHMSILFRITHLHIFHLFQELRRKVIQVIKIRGMDMKYVRMS